MVNFSVLLVRVKIFKEYISILSLKPRENFCANKFTGFVFFVWTEMQLRPSTRIFRVATVLKLHVATPQLFDILVLYYPYREPNDTEYYYE